MSAINNPSNNTKQYIVIMAGGSGTRMKSGIPKQLLDIGNDPMLVHLFRTSAEFCKDIILIVSNKNKDIILSTLLKRNYIEQVSDGNDKLYKYNDVYINICIQPIANGTGGAIMATKSFFQNNNPNDHILILSADVPLITKNTINNMFSKLENNVTHAVILVKETDDNYGYGRIMFENNTFLGIVEQKDCNEDQEQIKLINTGIYAFKLGQLMNSLDFLDKNNSQKEYYITDCPKKIQICTNALDSVKLVTIYDDIFNETLGANTPEQLDMLKNEYIKKIEIMNSL